MKSGKLNTKGWGKTWLEVVEDLNGINNQFEESGIGAKRKVYITP